MFVKVVTKANQDLWLKTEQEILGRHEIARIAFRKWELREALRIPRADVSY